MRALARFRTLAAALMLLLCLAAAAAAVKSPRPIEQPGGPPDPNPQEVGDPDFGGGSLWHRFAHVFRASMVSHPLLSRFALRARVTGRSPALPSSRNRIRR
jgi:hypothetical protein